jgi:chemotaxis protein MotB
MARRKSAPREKKGGDSWIMTYGDMMSLLLTFFVLIVSFSSIQESKFQQVALSLQGAFGVMNKPPTVVEMPQLLIPEMSAKERQDILQEIRRLERSLLDTGLDKEVDIKVTERGIAFRINAPFLFDTGRAELKAPNIAVLSKLAGFFQRFDYPLRIEGHTDSVPIHNERFPSNWELSAARAVAVARFFQAEGVAPERMAAIGFGEYHPLAANDTTEDRAKNRRVEIFLRLEKNRAATTELPLVDEERDDG